MSARSDGGVVTQEVAAEVLAAVEEENISVKTALSRLKISDYKIRSSVHAYAMETAKRLNAIDRYLAKASKYPLNELDPFVRNLLRIAVYEMKFKGVHPALATDSAVRIAKKRRKSVRFVNAVLRKVEELEIDYGSLSKTEAYALRYFHPEWFVSYAIELLGEEEAVRLMKANNELQVVYVRANELKSTAEAVRRYLEANRCELLETPVDGVFEVTSYEKHPAALDWHAEGKYVIQDLASCFVAVALDPQPGETVLDLAAAPGMKTSHIAMLMENRGRIVAVDISAERLERMKAKLRQLGVRNVELLAADGCRVKVEADKALADVPCSSTGSLHLHPNVKWSFDPAKFRATLSVQKKMLENALSNASEVVYSTCSILVEENEMQVAGCKIEKLRSPFARGVRKFRDFVFEDWKKVVRTYPHVHRTSGFFIAKLSSG